MARLLLRTAGVLTALLLLACAILVADGLSDELAPSDLGVVLGSKVNEDGRPSARLAARLDKAAELYRRGLVRRLFVSGGTGKEGFAEAAVMSDYLIAHGVPADRIVLDPNGVTTAATAHNAAAYMRGTGMKSALVVTQYFHVPRTRLALQRQGVKTVRGAHADHFEWRDLYSIPREVVGYAVYLVR